MRQRMAESAATSDKRDLEIRFLVPASEPYVGRDYESSALDYIFVWPFEDLWNSGYRFGQCIVFDLEGTPLTGSAYQSGW